MRVSRAEPGRATLAVLAIVIAAALVTAGTALLIGGDARATSTLARSSPSTAVATPASTMIAPTTAAPPSITPASAPPPSAPPSPVPSPVPSAPPSFPPLAAGVVPILYLHRVEAPPVDFSAWPVEKQQTFLAYDVLPSAFEAQLDWLQAHGYTTILPRDLARHWDRGTPLPPRPVIISLDDGFPSWNRTVLPMLEAHHMVAEFYLTIDAISYGRMSWDDVRALARAGNGIGAHDVHHIQLTALGPDKPPASIAAMWAEIHGARVIIGQEIGILPDSMAYVGGGFDANLVSLVRQAGFTTARSILHGIDQTRAHRFTLRVVRIGVRDDVADVLTGELVPGLPVFAAKMAGAR
jgi:peptidoglycan/xylan/chitin deacetylase (PgdA/CDA1 family)